MIKEHIPKDIRKFDDKMIGVFSKRQVFSIVAIFVVFLIFYQVKKLLPFEINGDLYTIFLIICELPVLAVGFLKFGNIPFEQWFRDIFLRTYNPKMRRRPYIVENSFRKLNEQLSEDGKWLTEEELKEQKKKEEKRKKLAQRRRKRKWKPNLKNQDYDCYY